MMPFINLPFINLTGVTVPPDILALVPENLARENLVFPYDAVGQTISLVISDPEDLDTLQKLQYILNKDLRLLRSTREQIVEAINRHYDSTT
jgi:type IV pilus assembly protein PilB